MFLLQNTDSSISIYSLNMKCTTPLRLGVFFIRLVFHARKFPILLLSAVFNLYSKPFFWPQLPGQSGERRRLDPELLSPIESNSLWFYPRKQSFSCFFFFFFCIPIHKAIHCRSLIVYRQHHAFPGDGLGSNVWLSQLLEIRDTVWIPESTLAKWTHWSLTLLLKSETNRFTHKQVVFFLQF